MDVAGREEEGETVERKSCPRCRQQTLLGAEDVNRAALPYRLELQPVDAVGELLAMKDGRRSWTVHSSGDVYLRTARIIRSRPAGTTWRQQVHVDHACGKGDQ